MLFLLSSFDLSCATFHAMSNPAFATSTISAAAATRRVSSASNSDNVIRHFPLSRYTTSPGFDFKNKLAPRYNVPSMIFHETSVPPVRAAACVFDTAPYPPPFRRHFYCSISFDELQHKTPPHSIQNCAAARSFYGVWGVYRITMVRLILSQE